MAEILIPSFQIQSSHTTLIHLDTLFLQQTQFGVSASPLCIKSVIWVTNAQELTLDERAHN